MYITTVVSRSAVSDTHFHFKNKLKRFSIDSESAGPDFKLYSPVTLLF